LKAADANPLVAEPKTDFNATRPFKIIYFGISEDPLMAKEAKIAIFDHPTLIWRPLSSEPPWISA